jgi:hypothetical protein
MPLQQRGSVLDLDWTRANAFPVNYDTDLENVWSNPSKMLFLYYRYIFRFCVCTALFADGDDFSWETIQKGRNVYYQTQMVKAQRVKIMFFYFI